VEGQRQHRRRRQFRLRTAVNKPYRWLAEYFDQLFGDFMPWSAAARRKILGRILPQVTSACDLACGTGTTALQLAGLGIRTFALDLSPWMCRRARAKARQASLPVRVMQADMRDFKLPQPVDLVLCEFDALNHLAQKADLALVLDCVAKALRPGGWFYFDVNTRLAFEKAWPLTWFVAKPDVAVVMHGGYDRERDRAWSDVEWFIRRGRHWVRRHERVEEVCWTGKEMGDALQKAGFGSVRAWDAKPFFGSDCVVKRGYRTIYLARLTGGLAGRQLA
jgi:SAM-dependent methyltransferase